MSQLIIVEGSVSLHSASSSFSLTRMARCWTRWSKNLFFLDKSATPSCWVESLIAHFPMSLTWKECHTLMTPMLWRMGSSIMMSLFLLGKGGASCLTLLKPLLLFLDFKDPMSFSCAKLASNSLGPSSITKKMSLWKIKVTKNKYELIKSKLIDHHHLESLQNHP